MIINNCKLIIINIMEGTNNKPSLFKLPTLNLTRQPSTNTTTGFKLDEAPPRKILFTEHFVVDQSVDRLNTAILDETFQITVRNRIFDNEDDACDKEIFKTAKDDLQLISDEEDSAGEDAKQGLALQP